VAVTTPDQPFTDVTIDPEVINEATDWLNYNTREEIERGLDNATKDMADFDQQYGNIQRLRREAAVTAGNITASYQEAIIVAVGPGSAIAQRIEALEVTIEEDIAQAVDLLTTEINEVDGRVTANANAITSLTAQVDDVEANVTMRGEAMASPGGGWARYGVQVRLESGGDWSQAAFFMDAQPGMSRVIFKADEFIVSDGSTDLVPFFISGGVARMNVANIGTVTAGLIQSNDGKVRVELDGNRIIIAD
jgi:prefoldin subunit 5